ncbi:MAG: 4a-hydroxytetrahydrobiopterin dehydratase [Candidatus Lindowbacteria bacterium]|nr:4a-hydroxytetrahydrobiopterin dehydratase [Candidatus Lindowbacteria bacterium]
MGENKARLTDDETDIELQKLEGWRREGIFLKKDYIFENFKQINAFLPHLTTTIVSQNHHPDFSLVCAEKKVAVEVTTHSEGGITKADIGLAQALELWPRP